ncbi:unnamed protein product [Calypogeia fissa]
MDGGRLCPADLPENRVQVVVSRALKDQVDHLAGKRKIGPKHPVAFKVMARARRLASLRIFRSDCSDSLKNDFERQGFEYLAKLDDAANVVKIPPSVVSLLAEHDRACRCSLS